MDTLLQVDHVSKSYPLSQDPGSRVNAFFKLLFGIGSIPQREIIKDISFTLKRGESLGVLGVNGAGKSTLLKIISNVVKPTNGHVITHGKVGALLELGAGFQPELTGRENVRFSAGLYGLTAAFIEEKMDDIIAFADIGAYIDEPVKLYSSGMVVRLGFAIISTMKPDLLITDEVLAVGDEAFQKKCIAWMRGYLNEGGTIILVSHGLYHIQTLCQKAMWLDGGEIRQFGDPAPVCQAYQAWSEAKNRKNFAEKRNLQAPYRLENMEMLGLDENNSLPMGKSIAVKIRLCSPDSRPPVCAMGLVRNDGTPVYGSHNLGDNAPLRKVSEDTWETICTIKNPPLMPGIYEFRVHAMDPEAIRLVDTMTKSFGITGDDVRPGLTKLQVEWS